MDWFIVEKNQIAKEYLQHAVSSKNERDIRKDTVVWKKFEKGNEAETIYLWVTDGLGVEGGGDGNFGYGEKVAALLWAHFLCMFDFRTTLYSHKQINTVHS